MFANLPTNHIQDGRLSWDDKEVVEHIKELLNCPWYKDQEGFLYIVTPDEIEGPGTLILDALNWLYRHDWPAGSLDHSCQVTKIDDCLKRFNRHDGFYHA